MAHYEFEVVGDPYRPADMDPRAIGLRVTRDGGYFQYLVPVVSGIALATELRGTYGSDRFWPAAIRWATEQFESLVDTEAIPLDPPTNAYMIPVDSSRAKQYVEDLSVFLPTSAPSRIAYEVDF